MLIKLQTLCLIVSLTLNGLIIVTMVVTAASKPNAASLSFPAVDDGYTAAAAVVVFPSSSNWILNPVEITLKTAQTAYLQYSVVSARNKQTNLFVSALYDPQVIAVEYADDVGITITALREGDTLLQYIANDGIKDLARITITK